MTNFSQCCDCVSRKVETNFEPVFKPSFTNLIFLFYENTNKIIQFAKYGKFILIASIFSLSIVGCDKNELISNNQSDGTKFITDKASVVKATKESPVFIMEF